MIARLVRFAVALCALGSRVFDPRPTSGAVA